MSAFGGKADMTYCDAHVCLNGLQEIARHEKMTISVLVKGIADSRTSDNLSSAIRMFVFKHFRTRVVRKPAGEPE